ncbi:hypothetical protein HG530_008077 [Fusarium avenaceum]|nr:hypothetical protein HG530_008077 [Fusarium avenaceum]
MLCLYQDLGLKIVKDCMRIATTTWLDRINEILGAVRKDQAAQRSNAPVVGYGHWYCLDEGDASIPDAKCVLSSTNDLKRTTTAAVDIPVDLLGRAIIVFSCDMA